MLAKLHLAINVAPVACSPLQRFGGNGTKRLISAKGIARFSYTHLNCARPKSESKFFSQTLRDYLCSGRFLCPLSSPRPRPSNLFRPRSPACSRLQSLCIGCHFQNVSGCRPPQVCRCRSRCRESTKHAQSPCREGKTSKPPLSPTTRPPDCLQP